MRGGSGGVQGSLRIGAATPSEQHPGETHGGLEMCPLELTFVLPSWHSSLRGKAGTNSLGGVAAGAGTVTAESDGQQGHKCH